MDPTSTRTQTAARSLLQPQVPPRVREWVSLGGTTVAHPRAQCTGVFVDSCPLFPSLVCKMTEFPEGTKSIFKTESLRPPGAESFFLPTHYTQQSSRFFTKTRIVWILQSPCCCLAKLAAEEFSCPLIIPTDIERWTCERIGFCQCLFPFLTDIQ